LDWILIPKYKILIGQNRHFKKIILLIFLLNSKLRKLSLLWKQTFSIFDIWRYLTYPLFISSFPFDVFYAHWK
jgi:hypothetical protein